MFRGHEGIERFLTQADDDFDEFRNEPLEFIDAGDRVVNVSEITAIGKQSRAPVRFTDAAVYTISDVLITRVQICGTREKALETAGLSEYALSANSVGTKQLKNKAVTNKKIDKKTIKNSRVKKENLKGNRIKDGPLTEKEIADGTLTGSKIADGSIGDSKLSDVEVFGDSFVKATATNGANVAAARAAAPEMTLFTKGPLSVTAKCFRDTGGDQTYGEIYGKTTVASSILDGDDLLPGGAAAEYLNPGTADTARQIDSENTAGGNDASYGEDEYAFAAPDGTALVGETAIAVKNGNLAGGNGPYGAGNVCLFQGDAHG